MTAWLTLLAIWTVAIPAAALAVGAAWRRARASWQARVPVLASPIGTRNDCGRARGRPALQLPVRGYSRRLESHGERHRPPRASYR
jgi:hypothetical protein